MTNKKDIQEIIDFAERQKKGLKKQLFFGYLGLTFAIVVLILSLQPQNNTLFFIGGIVGIVSGTSIFISINQKQRIQEYLMKQHKLAKHKEEKENK